MVGGGVHALDFASAVFDLVDANDEVLYLFLVPQSCFLELKALVLQLSVFPFQGLVPRFQFVHFCGLTIDLDCFQ